MNKIVSIFDDPIIFLDKAKKLKVKKDYYKALKYVNRAIDIDKYNEDALLLKAEIYSDMKLYKYANQILFKLSLKNDYKAESYMHLIDNFLKNNELETVMTYAAKYLAETGDSDLVITDDKDQDILISKVEDTDKVANFVPREEMWDLPFDIEEEKQDLKSQFKLVYPRTIDYDKVLADARTAGYFSNIDEAINIIEKNDPEKDKTNRTLKFLTMLYLSKEDFLKAREIAKKVINNDPNDIEAYCNLISTYIEMDKENVEEIKDIIDKVESFDVKDVSHMKKLAIALLQLKQEKRAAEIFKKVLDKSPYDVDVMHMLGITYYNIGEIDKSLDVFLKAYNITQSVIPKYYIGYIKEKREQKKHKKLQHILQIPVPEYAKRLTKIVDMIKAGNKLEKLLQQGTKENELLIWFFTTDEIQLKKMVLQALIEKVPKAVCIPFFKDLLLDTSENFEVKICILELLVLYFIEGSFYFVFDNVVLNTKPIIPRNRDNISLDVYHAYARAYACLALTERGFEPDLYKEYKKISMLNFEVNDYSDICSLAAVLAYSIGTKESNISTLVKLFSGKEDKFNEYFKIIEENKYEKNN